MAHSLFKLRQTVSHSTHPASRLPYLALQESQRVDLLMRLERYRNQLKRARQGK